jgi:hypothetical protein
MLPKLFAGGFGRRSNSHQVRKLKGHGCGAAMDPRLFGKPLSLLHLQSITFIFKHLHTQITNCVFQNELPGENIFGRLFRRRNCEAEPAQPRRKLRAQVQDPPETINQQSIEIHQRNDEAWRQARLRCSLARYFCRMESSQNANALAHCRPPACDIPDTFHVDALDHLTKILEQRKPLWDSNPRPPAY